MSALFEGFELPADVKDDGDFLGGFSVLESGYYDFVVDLAYLTVAESGAKAMNIVLKSADGKQTLRQQFWMSSGTAKGGLPYYTNQKTLEKKYLPGFILANNLCMLAAGKQLLPALKNVALISTEEKVISLYNGKEGRELPTKVQMFTDLLGKPISAGVIKQIVDKTKKNDQTGVYEPTGETRTENEVDKFFRSKDGMTVTEIVAKATEAKFRDQWAAKWNGQVKDKSTKANGTPGAPGAFVPPKAATATADALFA